MGFLAEVASAEVRAEMARQRRSRADLADLLKRSSETIRRRLEPDEENPKGFELDELHVIAQWLDVPVVQFLGPERAA